MHTQRLAHRKNNALQIHGTQQRYDNHCRAKEISSTLYARNLDIYTHSLTQRIQFDAAEIAKLIRLLREGKLTPDVLEYNAISCFYPSYILHHHFAHFLPLARSTGVAGLIEECQQMKSIGAVFDQTINSKFQKPSGVGLVDGKICMADDEYFYSMKTNHHIHVCCFETKVDETKVLCFVRLRDANGKLAPGVSMKDFGSTISADYCTVGYRLDQATPIAVVKQIKILRQISSDISLSQFNYSLQDLMSSLLITVKYTSLRRQFSTLEDSKEERRIIDYQAVSSRITDGFSSLYMLSFLRQRMITLRGVAPFMQRYIPLIHQLILPRLIELRECCGGFGYLQASGHPALIERVSIRCAQPFSTFIPENPELMKRIMYYSSDDSLEQLYIEQQKGQFSLLSLFAIICINMKKRKDEISKEAYVRAFIAQICIQLMNRTLTFIPSSESNPFENILPYVLIYYILNNSQYLPFQTLGISPIEFTHKLIEKRTALLQTLTKSIPELLESLDANCSPHIVTGIDEKAFYEEVMETSQKNKRNSEEFRKFVQEPLVKVIKQQKAKL